MINSALLLLGMIGYQLFLTGVELWLIATVVILLALCGLLLLLLFPALHRIADWLSSFFPGKSHESGRFEKLVALLSDTSKALQKTAQKGIIGQVLILSLPFPEKPNGPLYLTVWQTSLGLQIMMNL